MKKLLTALFFTFMFSANIYSGTLSTHAWVLNSDVSISSSKTYTHTVDLGSTFGNTSYDGVSFDSAGNTGGVIEGSSCNFSLTSTDAFGDVSSISNNLEEGFSYNIVSDMVYPTNGVAILKLTGLIPGGAYQLVLYSIGWENGSRISLIYGDDDVAPDPANLNFQVNQDEYGVGNGILVTYDYIAPQSGELNIYVQKITAGWHFYGFSNESFPVSPEDESRRVSRDNLLQWPFEDSKADSYDVYLGKDYQSVLDATEFSSADYDKSGLVDFYDYAALAKAWLTSDSQFDHDSTGIVDMGDVDFFIANWLANSNPNYITTVNTNFHQLDNLDVFQTYYWRIDENVSESTSKGQVHSFTVSPEKSVPVRESSLMSQVYLSDTFSINSLRDKLHDFAWYAANLPQSLNIESTIADTVSWYSNYPARAYFRTSNASYNGFGNKSSSSGVLEIENNSVSLFYNQDDNEFVVQFDAILPSVRSNDTSGRLEINCSGAGTAFTGDDGVFSVFLKKVGIFHEISFYNSNYGEKKVLQNISTSDNEWHNYAVSFNKSIKTVEVFIDEESVFSIDLNEFYNGAFASYIDDSSIGIGGDGSLVIDNVQIGKLGYTRVNHPEPANGTGTGTDVNLQWIGTVDGIGYDVYIGDDYNTVSNATSDSICYYGRQTANSYGLSSLISGKDYYWRIDQVINNDVVKGKVWKFSSYGPFMTYSIAAPTRLYYIDSATYSSFSDQEKRLLSMLQGIVSKFKPEIYVCLHNDHVAYLDDVKNTYGIFTTDVDSVRGSSSPLLYLLSKYKNRVDGYVLYDQDTNSESILVATSLAAIYDYLPVDISLVSYMQLAGISQVADVRDKDSQWLYDNYWDGFRHDAICVANPDPSYFARLYDLAIASGIPMFWDSDPFFNAQLLDSLLPNGIVYGWGNPSIGADWPDEANFVELYSSNAACIAPTDAVQNLTVMAGMASYTPKITFSMPNRPLDYQPESNVHYVAFLVGDMDHVLDGLHFTGSDRAYGTSDRGTIPMNWQTPAYMTRLSPSSLSWFYRNATPNDHFADFFSGLYMHPHIHSDLGEYCRQLNQMATEADQRVTVLSEKVSSDATERQLWAEKVGSVYASMSAFRGFFTYPILQGDGSVYWIDGKPFVNHRFVLQDGDNDVTPAPFALNSTELASAINAMPADPTSESGYSFVYIANWGHAAYTNAMETVALLDTDVRVVSMEELIERIYQNMLH